MRALIKYEQSRPPRPLVQISEAARRAGIHRSLFDKWLKRIGIIGLVHEKGQGYFRKVYCTDLAVRMVMRKRSLESGFGPNRGFAKMMERIRKGAMDAKGRKSIKEYEKVTGVKAANRYRRFRVPPK